MRPNVILIFTDNQQAATIGCYGNHEVYTPNLDALAASGMRFTRSFGVNAFCSPNRASLMTGLLPSQHGVHSWIDDRKSDQWPAGWNALAGLKTLPQELQALGYKTGLFGKYHLGDPQTPPPGWNNFVTMADGHVRSFYDNTVFDNGETYPQSGHSVDFFTDKAIDFVTRAKRSAEPYFAFVPLPAPYGHWPSTNDGNRNRYADLYDDCPLESVPRTGLSAAAVRKYDMTKSTSGKGLDLSMLMCAPNDPATLKNYYSQLSLIDESVGKLVKADPDALIIFTSDHGLSLGHHGFWGHGGATYPSNLHLAAHSVPLIVRHNERISVGSVSSTHVSNTDLFATILRYAGGEPDGDLPSRSYAAELKGEHSAEWGANEVFAEQEETRVIRTPGFVYFKRFASADSPPLYDELYDVVADPDETRNIVGEPQYQPVAEELSARIEKYFEQYTAPKADLWNGGCPVQNSVMIPYWQSIWGREWNPVYQY